MSGRQLFVEWEVGAYHGIVGSQDHEENSIISTFLFDAHHQDRTLPLVDLVEDYHMLDRVGAGNFPYVNIKVVTIDLRSE